MLMFIRKKEPGRKLRVDQETLNQVSGGPKLGQEARNELQEAPGNHKNKSQEACTPAAPGDPK